MRRHSLGIPRAHWPSKAGRDRTISNQIRIFAFKLSFTLILILTMGLVLAVTSIIALILLDVRRETGEITEHVKVRRLSLSTAVSDVFAGPIACNDAEALAKPLGRPEFV